MSDTPPFPRNGELSLALVSLPRPLESDTMASRDPTQPRLITYMQV